MEQYLFLARSVTQAQRMSRVLENCGIRTSVFRPPMGLTEQGCSYAVKIRTDGVQQARQCLQKAGLQPLRIFAQKDGGYREMEL